MSKNIMQPPPVKKKENLKQRAYLNTITSIIDYTGAQITGFIVSPFIVGGLGSSLYGTWQMLTQMTGYAGMADIRASQVLKWSIANKKDIAEDEELKSDVTTALLVTLLILPLVLIIGGIIIWYAPIITRADKEYYDLVRIACSLLVLSLIINKVFNLFESILRGMNLGFKRMGFRAGIVIIGGSLKVLAITNGFGLIGLSFVEILIAIITGTTFYFIVRQNISWFGFGKTNFKKIISYGRLSGWFMAYTGTKFFLFHSDKIILGYLAGPSVVTKYAITMFATNAIQGLLNSVIMGIIPGMGGLFGKNEFEKVIKGRRVIITINWLLSVSLGVAVLLFNRSFIMLWIGEEHYAGAYENFLILLISVQAIFFQLDSFIINVTLNMKKKVMFSSFASLITIFLAFILVKEFSIIGLCCSILIGRFILTIGYPMVLKERIKDKSSMLTKQIIQPILISGLLFIAATYAGQWLIISNWIYLLSAGVITTICAGIIFLFVGIRYNERNEVWEVLSKVKFLNKSNNI